MHFLTWLYSDTAETNGGAEEEKETGSPLPTEAAPHTNKKSDSSDTEQQLDEKLKQLSLDSAYTSEADLESSTNSPRRHSQDLESPGEDASENGSSPKPPDLSMIAVRKSPLMSRPQLRQSQQKRPANLPPLSSLPSAATHGLYNPPAYFHPAYPYPYTPPMAIQTIGPVYHQ